MDRHDRPQQAVAKSTRRPELKAYSAASMADTRRRASTAAYISLNMGRSAPVTIDPTNPQTLYVGSSGGVFKSLDGGDHCIAVNSGLDELSGDGPEESSRALPLRP